MCVFSQSGKILASAYEEYDVHCYESGQAGFETENVWAKIKSTIARAAAATPNTDPITALSTSSLGEAVVPVTKNRYILGNSILNFDVRGKEYVYPLIESLTNEELYRINGNTWGNCYAITKLMWLKHYKHSLYEKTDMFLN